MSALALALPAWLPAAVPAELPAGDDAAAMALAAALAAENVARGTGGPFGAVVVDGAGHVAGAGVNVVVAQASSLCHAEVMALLAAQRAVGRARLNEAGDTGPWTLVTSAQPCVMCFGTAFWAGLDALVIGASAEDVEQLAGFDEGPLPADWAGELRRRGVAVRQGVRREECRAVLRGYGEAGGVRY